MKEHEELLSQVHSFEDALLDPQVRKRLEGDPEFKKAFEAQRQAVRLVQLKRYETQSEESATRIRAGVLRTIRSETAAPAAAASPAWWGGFKLAASLAVLALLALPFLLKPSGDLQPVTSFSVSDPGTELADDGALFQMPEETLLVASNTAPSTQFGPVEVAPVNFDVP